MPFVYNLENDKIVHKLYSHFSFNVRQAIKLSNLITNFAYLIQSITTIYTRKTGEQERKIGYKKMIKYILLLEEYIKMLEKKNIIIKRIDIEKIYR